MANFFINRPVFAWVIAIILMMAGAIAIPNMPVAQISEHRPSGRIDLGYLSGSICRNRSEHGGSGHRTATKWNR